jgi:hypothetical protein
MDQEPMIASVMKPLAPKPNGSSSVGDCVLPCIDCGDMPVMIHDEHGYSCLHICLPHRMYGSFNYQTADKAISEWNRLNIEKP